jgi:hypothetical protein
MQAEKADSHEVESIRKELQVIKDRINLIEASLDIQKWKQNFSLPSASELQEDDFDLSFSSPTDDTIEFRVGEYGMAWLGNIVLLFGISFLVQYLQNSGYPIFSVLTGYLSVAGIYAGYFFTRTSYSYISKLFAYTGHLLMFYMAVHLHFLQDEPLIKSDVAGLFLLIVTIAVLFYISFRRKSQLMTGMALFMILVSGTISNSVQINAAMSCIAAILAMVLYYRLGWLKLVLLFIFLVYLSHLNWLLNNPILGNELKFIANPGMAYLYFIATGFIFSSLTLIPKRENIPNELLITIAVLNGLGFSFILALIVFTYLIHNYIPVFSAIAILCLVYSVILQSCSMLKITASMYALYGFLAMSVAFYGILLLPQAYMLLAVQSLLVVSMALWFRSRFIVVMNTILFLMLLIFYLNDKSNLSTTNFSFMMVAFVTARVINWKKERLNIKTELIRNIYLVSGFIMTLIAFYHAFPSSYITVSWISAAMLFFLLGRLMHNIKYRWLAIGALGASAIKLIFVDLSSIDIGFRVLVFLLLAIISITVSILYTKYLSRKKE